MQDNRDFLSRIKEKRHVSEFSMFRKEANIFHFIDDIEVDIMNLSLSKRLVEEME